jgi:hypothetical protein
MHSSDSSTVHMCIVQNREIECHLFVIEAPILSKKTRGPALYANGAPWLCQCLRSIQLDICRLLMAIASKPVEGNTCRTHPHSVGRHQFHHHQAPEGFARLHQMESETELRMGTRSYTGCKRFYFYLRYTLFAFRESTEKHYLVHSSRDTNRLRELAEDVLFS